MKLLVIGIDGIACDRLLDPERFPTVARLQELGWHGTLAGGEWTGMPDEVTRQGRRADVISSPGANASDPGQALRDGFSRVRECLRAGDAAYVEFSDAGHAALARKGSSDAALDAHAALLDAQLAETLEALDGDTAILVLSPGAGFVLAGASGAVGDRLEGVRIADLVLTLCELGGLDAPARIDGKSLVAPGSASSAAPGDLSDEEQQMRDHLRGLGYL